MYIEIYKYMFYYCLDDLVYIGVLWKLVRSRDCLSQKQQFWSELVNENNT